MSDLARRLPDGPRGRRLPSRSAAELPSPASAERSDAATVAHSLGMSERTLRRRLTEAGSSYKGVHDAFRAAEAERLLLESNASAAQVGLALGFADQTAFIRAFRRWKGSTPGAWRTQRLAERDGD